LLRRLSTHNDAAAAVENDSVPSQTIDSLRFKKNYETVQICCQPLAEISGQPGAKFGRWEKHSGP
jgi:hypothetical protein